MPQNTGAADLAPDQFGQRELTYEEASAFCGPVAAIALFKALRGAHPTITQVKEWAKEVGWTPQAGMAGPRSQQALLAKGGVDSKIIEGNVSRDILAAAVKNTPVNISTDKHWFVADDYDEATGKFHVGVGQTTALKNGAEWMTYDEISHAAGASGINGILIPKYDPSSDPDITGWPKEVTNVTNSAAPIIEQNVKDVKARQDAVATRIKEYATAREEAGARLSKATGDYDALTKNADQRIANLMAEGMDQPGAYAAVAKDFGNALSAASQAKSQATIDYKTAVDNWKEAQAEEAKLATEWRGWQEKLAAAKDVTQQSLDNRLKYLTTMVSQGKITSDMAQAAWDQELEKAKMGTNALIQGYSAIERLGPRMGNQAMADAVVSSLRGWSKFTGNDLPQGFNLPIIPLGDIMAEFKAQVPAWSQERMNDAQKKMADAVSGIPDWKEAFKNPSIRDKGFASAMKAIEDAERVRGLAGPAGDALRSGMTERNADNPYPYLVGNEEASRLRGVREAAANMPGSTGAPTTAPGVGGIPAAYDPNTGTPESFGANDFKAGMAAPAAPRPSVPYQGRGLGPGVQIPGAPAAPVAAATAAPGTGDPVASFKQRWQGKITKQNMQDVKMDFEATFPTQKPIDLVVWLASEQTRLMGEAPQE